MALAFFAPGLTAGVVEGVVEATDGGSLPGVNMTLTPTDGSGRPPRTSTTGPTGAYKFQNVPPGRYQLTASSEVFATGTRNIVVQQDGQVLTVNFVLTIDFANDEITVTGVYDAFGNITSPNVALSEGPSFLTLFGEFPFGQLVLNDALDPSLGNVKVFVNNGQTDFETDIYYGSKNQVAVRTPVLFIDDSDWTIKVCELSDCSAPYRLNVGRHAPFVAAVAGNGIGDAAAQDGSFNLITFVNPMKDIGVLWVNGQVEPGAVGKVFLNGQEQKTLYYGGSGLDGLTQFNIQIDPNTGSGHVTGFVEETFADGTSRFSQPFNTWVEIGSPVQDHFLGNLAPQVYGAGGLDTAEVRFGQTHQVRLNEKNEIIADSNLFITDVNLLNLNPRTYNAVTPGNPQAAVLPFGYPDPRQDILFSGTAAVNVENFTQFTMATADNPTLLQVFADPAGRTFQGAVTVNLSGTIDGSAANATLQGSYERQSAAIDLLEQDFTNNLEQLLNDYPFAVWESIRRAAAQVAGNETVLFFANEAVDCDRFGSMRIDLWMTREQVQILPNTFEERVKALAPDYLEGLYGGDSQRDVPCTSTYSWGIQSWDALTPPEVDPFFDHGSLNYRKAWVVQRPTPPRTGGN